MPVHRTWTRGKRARPADDLEVLVVYARVEARTAVLVGVEVGRARSRGGSARPSAPAAARARPRAAASARARRRTRACRPCRSSSSSSGPRLAPSANRRSPRRRAASRRRRYAVDVGRPRPLHADRGERVREALERSRATYSSWCVTGTSTAQSTPAAAISASSYLGRRLGLRRESSRARRAGSAPRRPRRRGACASTTVMPSTYRRAASAYSSAAWTIPATGALSFGACARGRKPGANAAHGRDAGRELEVRRVGRAGEHAGRPLVAEHDPARLAQRRDERMPRRRSRSPGTETSKSSSASSSGIVGGRVARETHWMSSTSCSRVIPGIVRMSQPNSASPGTTP